MVKVNAERFILFRDIFEDELIKEAVCFIENKETIESEPLKKQYFSLQSLLIKKMKDDFCGSYWQGYLAEAIAFSENAFSLGCEKGKMQDYIFTIAEREFEILQKIYLFDWSSYAKRWNDEETSLFHMAGTCTNSKREKLHEILSRGHVKDLQAYYNKNGCGIYEQFSAFKWHEQDGLMGISNYDQITFEDLTEYYSQKTILIENTEYFLNGKKANNILLYGDRGTGKSSSVKALLNKYKDKKLKMIEITKEQFCIFPIILKKIMNRGYKFIIFIDDLSFEEFETDYKHFKAILEGGLEVRPRNVVIYATSNRRNIIKETWKDQGEVDTEIHGSDSIQEKISLVNRFGITITYPSPDKNLFLRMVKDIANKEQVLIQEDVLYHEALKWEMRYHGFSGRSARQFMDYMVSKTQE